LLPALGTSSLQPYLRIAIEQDLVELSTIISKFLARYRVFSISELGTTSMVAQFILDLQFNIPKSSVIGPNTIQDALSLLTAVYMPPLSPYEVLVHPISQLVTIILSDIHHNTSMSSTLVAICLGMCNDLLSLYQLPSQVRSTLEMVSMSLGDGTKVAPSQYRSLHMDQKQGMFTPEVLPPSSLSLLINHLVRKSCPSCFSSYSITRYAFVGLLSVAEVMSLWQL
jgi:hypothetical protein